MPNNRHAFYFMVVGMFMAILDIQIVASSITEIQAALSACSDEISWIQTSYLIAEVIMIPICGSLARIFSTRLLFCGCAALFTASSALCALSWNLESMIFFRVIQGFFGGAMIPTVFSSIFFIFKPKERSKAMIIAGVVTTMAPTLGPTVGGWITNNFSWHWMFLVNVLPGFLLLFKVSRLLDIDKPNFDLIKKFDYKGLALLAVGLGTLELFLKKGQKNDWFDSYYIIILSIISFGSLLLSIVHSLRGKDPIISVQAFLDPNFSIGCIISFATGVGLFGAVYLLPLMLSTVRGYNSLQIGVVMSVTGIFMFLSGPLAGALEKKIDLRIMLGIGLALFGTGMVINGNMTSEMGFSELFWPQAIRGISIMLCFLPMTQVALGRLPKETIANASGLYNLMRNLGGAIGIALIDTLLNKRIDYHTYILKSSFSPVREYITNIANYRELASGLVQNLDYQDLGFYKVLFMKINKQALTLAFNDTFAAVGIYLWLCILLLIFVRTVNTNADGQALSH